MQKYKNIIITPTPSEQFPELVTLTKTPKNKAHFLNKKYINTTKAILAIDAYIAEELIGKGEKSVKAELESVFGAEVEVGE